MNLIHLAKKKLILFMSILLIASTVIAQNETAPAEKAAPSGYNQLEILLVFTAFFLAFVIWAFGRVLVILSKQLLEKNKNATKVISAVLIATTLLLSAQTSSAQTTSSAETAKVISNYGGISATAFYFFAAVIAVEMVAILFLYFAIQNVYKELATEKDGAKQVSKLRLWWSQLDKKVFTKAVPIEREADYLLDHNYDGIQELDNALPPWWKYGFYITIVVAIIYLLNFHVLGNGKNPTEEYAAEMEQARISKEAYDAKNKDKIDENNVPVADAAGLAKGKEIFTSVCWACHGKSGEGGAGPNLTDDYWLHKGSLNDIYHTIKFGYPDKGMQSWASVYSPKEISYLASYVKSLHGTNPPNAKAPQGDLYKDTDSTGTAKPDSTIVKAATKN